MSEDPLWISLLIGIPVGVIVGIVTRKRRPDWCKSFAKFCMDGKWWIYAVGIVMFLGFSIMSFADGRLYSGVFFFLLSCLEVFALIRSGFERLTREQEARIDAADPTKLWPIQFWRQIKP